MYTRSFVLAALLAPSALLAQNTTVKTKTKAPAGTEKAKTTVQAPAPAPSEEQVAARAAALTANMQKALGLNPQQVEKVGQINLNSVRAVEAARLRYRRNVQKMASVVEDVSQSRLSMLKDVLSAQQFDRYQRKREEKMGIPSSQGIQGNPVPGLPGSE